MTPKEMEITKGSEESPEIPDNNNSNIVMDASTINISIISPTGEIVDMGPQPNSDTVSSIKIFLTEILETSFYTNYSFEYRDSNGNRIIKLNEYVELKTYFPNYDHTSQEKILLHMVLSPYDVRTTRAHMKRLHEIIKTVPPKRNRQIAVTPNEENLNTNKKNISENKSDLLKLEDVIDEKFELKNFYQDTLIQLTPQNTIKPLLLRENILEVSVSGWNPPPPSRKLAGDLLYIQVITKTEGTFHLTAVSDGFYINKTNANTGFDPSPMTGNAYFSHELILTITGFSKSVASVWDNIFKLKHPETKTQQSDIFDDITGLSTLTNLLESGKVDQMSMNPVWVNPPIQKNMIEFLKSFEELSFYNGKNQHDTHQNYHSYDVPRAYDDLCNSFGADITSPPREWNEEIQSVRSMPSSTFQEKTLKYKYTNKILSEFIEACRFGAIAVVEGHISPLNPMDQQETHVFIYNNIFFSRAMDSKESFKLCEGDEACKKYAGLDLKNQRLIQSYDIEGLHTVMTAIIDYKGERIVAQTVIPGILSAGERSARLMHGCLEHGKNLTCKETSLKLLSELAAKLHLAKRTINVSLGLPSSPVTKSETSDIPLADSQSIRVDDIDEIPRQIINKNTLEVIPAGAGSDPLDSESTIECIPHIGPIEGKLIEGSDGRVYILEFMRITPRDANYVIGEKGTKFIEDKILETAGEQLCCSYVLRHELLSIYTQRELSDKRKQIVIDAVAKQKIEKGKAIESNQNESSNSIPETDGDFKLTPEISEQLKLLHDDILSIELNPNVFIHKDVVSDIHPNVEKKDEEIAQKLSQFLGNFLLPLVTEQVQSTDLNVCDGATLCNYLHNFGINIRYLGKLAMLALDQEKEDEELMQTGKQRQNSMPKYWLELLEIEMVARAVKHLLNKYMSDDSRVKSAPACTIATLLSFLLGLPKDEKLAVLGNDQMTGSNKKNKSKDKSATLNEPNKFTSEYVSKSLESRGAFFKDLKNEIFKRFGYQLTLLQSGVSVGNVYLGSIEDKNLIFDQRVSRYSLLRRVCQQTGIKIAMQDYNLEFFSTESASVALSTSPPTKYSVSSFFFPFRASDIIELIPKIKSCEPDLPFPETKELANTARVNLQNGNIDAAIEVAQESLQIIQYVTNGVHKEILNSYDLLISALITCGDLFTALTISSRSLFSSIQLTGLDSSETLQNHLHVATLLSEIGEYNLALKHLKAARYIAILSGGNFHPEILGIIIRIAGIYKAAGYFDSAIKSFLECHHRLMLGGDQIKHAMILENLAATYSMNNQDKEAINKQILALNLMQQLFGEEHEKTVECRNTLKGYQRSATEKAVLLAKKKMLEAEQDKERERNNWLEDDLPTSKANKGTSNHSKNKKNKKK